MIHDNCVFFLSAMVHLRNIPDNNCQVSQAKIKCQLWDSFLSLNRIEKFSNHTILAMWRKAWKLKEETLHGQFARNTKTLVRGSAQCDHFTLITKIVTKKLVQNQSNSHPKKKAGLVVIFINKIIHNQNQLFTNTYTDKQKVSESI